MPVFGFVDAEGRMMAAATFTDYNHRNIAAHIAIVNPFATRALFRAIGMYVFEQLKCSRLTLIAESSNLPVIKLHQRLGAIHEGTLVGAGRSGDDILLSRFTPDCEFWRKISGTVK
jgi:RimJ/RimL family protein N-acetyltransferase